MKKITALAASLVILVAASIANASTLTYKSLRIKAPNNGFSKCVAAQAVTQFISKMPNAGSYQLQSLVRAELEGNGGTSRAAILHFTVGPCKTCNPATLDFSVYLSASDNHSEWQLHQDPRNGEVYPSSVSVDSAGTVFQWGEPIGSFDFSACQ